MTRFFLLALALALPAGCGEPPAGDDFAAKVSGYERLEGFIDLYRDDAGGRLYLRLDTLDEPLLYQSSMARGVGSNDLGLDRGQLGARHVVEFQRQGNRVLLVADNLDYRALSDNPDEQQAVDASFAHSVLWGFDIAGRADGAFFVDATDFFLRDAHGLARRLDDAGEGSYSVDASRSAIYAPRTKAFPDNSEVEAVVTYVGEPAGEILRTVVPDPTSMTVHLHHSFIRLPDAGYEPLAWDPRAGLIGLSYGTDGFHDYATPIGDELTVRYARRHRLEKKDPAAATSEPVEPIVYYLDGGAPEPVKSALLEGAGWWNQAFEAAGYENAFRVEMLPADADPMDVRYNVIQWVHRSTRGWSYGSSILDPRTGEILKGHVTLGSLRVRQDYLIAEGLLAPYGEGAGAEEKNAMLEMALARIRQLSAHEVGHTLGIQHNFAASTEGRSSVMDYPFPLVRFADDGGLDLGDAYDTGIGEWDERVILYGYQDLPDDVDAAAARNAILEETVANWKFVADVDSRAVGTPHPDGNLWDNGSDAIAELERLLRVRNYALERFGAANIPPGRPLATIEEALVPIYLLHRYQLHAVGKLVGGVDFSYAMRGDGRQPTAPVAAARQRQAIDALLATLDPAALVLPSGLAAMIPPRPPGYARTRESFPRHTGTTFDPLGPAVSAAALTLEVLLDRERAARLVTGHARNADLPGLADLLSALLERTWFSEHASGAAAQVQRSIDLLVLDELARLSADDAAMPSVRAWAAFALANLDERIEQRQRTEDEPDWLAHYAYARKRLARAVDEPQYFRDLAPVTVPPGSPIGGH